MTISPSTLFVIDDDPRSRKGMAALASSLNIPCTTFASAEEFLDRYEPAMTGCALVDFRLGGMDGLQLQDRLHELGSALFVVLVSANADVSMAVRALKNGAVSVIEKPYRNDDLADAICKAIDRSQRVRQSILELADERQRLESLTPREKQLLDLLVAGVPQKRMARMLKISLRTVNRLCANVYSKMGVTSAAELAGVATRLRQVESNPTPGTAKEDVPPAIGSPAFSQWRPKASQPMASRTLDRQPLIAYDLHDGVAQYLASALMHLENYERCRAPQREDAANAFREGVELIKRSIHELRSLIRGLHQATIEANLVDAFQGLIEDYQSMSQIEFIHDLPPLQLDPWLTSTLFRIAQESLTNACRHSRSEKIRVELIQHDGQLRLAVKDWGVGFDTKAVYGTKFGLCGIRERARMLGAKVTIDSALKQGTCISVQIPLDIRRVLS